MALVHSLSPIFSMEDEIFLLKYLYRGGGIINFAGAKRLLTICERQTPMAIRLI